MEDASAPLVGTPDPQLVHEPSEARCVEEREVHGTEAQARARAKRDGRALALSR